MYTTECHLPITTEQIVQEIYLTIPVVNLQLQKYFSFVLSRLCLQLILESGSLLIELSYEEFTCLLIEIIF